jgi:hypothetical protein
MEKRLVPYRYNSYSDVLIAAGTAELARTLYGLRRTDMRLRETPAGIEIEHPEGQETTEASPFRQIRDKESREIDESLPVWDKTLVEDDEDNPRWWTTVSVINTLGEPKVRFNNKYARAYTPKLGIQLLEGEVERPKGTAKSKSKLLYAQASKGVNKNSFGRGYATSQDSVDTDGEQMLALLGYQVGAAGFIKDDYTFSIVPRPKDISLQAYRNLVDGFLRGYFPRTDGGKTLPTRDQTVPFFVAMAYFDFIIKLFDYREKHDGAMGGWTKGGVGNVIASLDRALYFSMGTSSAPFALDTLTIPEWLDDKAVAVNVRNLIRELLSEHADPNMLYLPVRAFAERDPRPLVEFYRKYQPLQKPSSGNRDSKRLLHKRTLRYVMEKTDYADLNCDEMQRFARVLRLRTLSKFYQEGEQPDYNLLAKLKSASRNRDQLIKWLSSFIGEHNFRNERIRAKRNENPGPNLSYDDLQVIIGLVEKYDATFVANTLMAQAMSKRDQQAKQDPSETAAP